ncbi:hypothetical protein SB861_37870 [Paraburkholderia sp. SIMBA_049]
MAIDFELQFGNKGNNGKKNVGTEAPKAQFWLNIGFVAEGTAKPEEGKDDVFVSLPVGIPLDTMERLKTNSSNEEFAQLQAARNDLLDQIMSAAQKLQPGEDMVFTLQAQVRRVKEDKPVAVDQTNKFAAKLQFA